MRRIIIFILLTAGICLAGNTDIKPMLGTRIDFSHYLTRGLLVYWLMNEGVGTTVLKDVSGNNIDATFAATTASPSWVDGKFGPNISGDGGDYATAANESFLDFERTDRFSISCWINITTWGGAIVSKMVGGGNVEGWLLFAKEKTGPSEDAIGFELRSSGVSDLSITAAKDYTNLLGWHHIVATYTGSSSASGVKLYIDGIDEALDAATSDNLTTSILNNVSPQILGRDGANFLPTGEVDNVMIWNRTLTAEEAELLWTDPFVMFRSPLTKEFARGVPARFGSGELGTGKGFKKGKF